MKLYNTMTRKKEEFEPMTPGEVKMYSCGPTVYNYFHIGNARPFIIFDILRRYLEYRGYKVTFVQNFTDVDDKIIKRAKDENTTEKEVSDRYIKEYFKDAEALNIRKADYHPRVTEHIKEIIDIIKRLEANGFTYTVGGDVYYDTAKFVEYGKLSKQNLEELEAGARVDVNEVKRNPFDFVLWKGQKPGEPAWESPWGMGRPGWHIECSAMSLKYLGNHFDIHGGAQDLIFPHHENEIAQAEAYTGISPFSRYWIHTGWVTLNREKMSKSIGNVFLISEALKVVAPNVLRFFFVETLYSSPLEYNLDQLHQASRAFERIVITMQRLEEAIHRAKTGPIDEKILRGFERLHDSFHQALAQNFNTPQGIAVIMNAVRELNKLLDTTSLALEDLKTIQHYFEDWFETLGLVDVATTELSKDEWDLMAELKALASHHHIEFSDSTTLPEMIHAFIQKREQFRQNKQYFESDTIRNDLYALKIQLEDKKEGTEYRTIP